MTDTHAMKSGNDTTPSFRFHSRIESSVVPEANTPSSARSRLQWRSGKTIKHTEPSKNVDGPPFLNLLRSSDQIFPPTQLHPSLAPRPFLQPFFLTPPPLFSTYCRGVGFPQLVHISAPILHIPPPSAPHLPSSLPPSLPHTDLWLSCLTRGGFSKLHDPHSPTFVPASSTPPSSF